MPGVQIHLNEAAIRRLPKRSDVKAATRRLAQKVAQRVEDMDIRVGDTQADGLENIESIPVLVSDTDTVQVILAHPAGIAAEAKYGALTKAASAEGLHRGGG